MDHQSLVLRHFLCLHGHLIIAVISIVHASRNSVLAFVQFLFTCSWMKDLFNQDGAEKVSVNLNDSETRDPRRLDVASYVCFWLQGL